MKQRWLAITGAAMLAATGGAVALAQHQARADMTPASPAATITVIGHSDQQVKPDTAIIDAGVTTSAADAATAQQRNDAAVQKVMAALSGAGISADHVRTLWYNIQPTYGPPDKAGPPGVSGFQANDMIEIRLTNVSQVGSIIDLLVKAGANQINGVNFTVSNALDLQKQAYDAALTDARAQADSIAKALGVQITGVQSVDTESSGVPGPIQFAKAAAADASAPISTGTQTISTSVKVVYTIQNGQ